MVDTGTTGPNELTDPDDPDHTDVVTDSDATDTDAADTGVEAGEVDSDAIDVDEIVLPWWQHPLNILTLFVSIALVAGMVGWLVGDARARPTGSDVDIGFLHDMREHHENAFAIAFMYLDLDDTNPGLRTVSRNVILDQGVEIGRMIQLLRSFGAPEANQGDTSMVWMGMSSAAGSMPGMATRAQLDELAATEGSEADAMFVELMTAHHLGGLDMARFAMDNTEDAEVRAMAASIVAKQQGEIVQMQQLLD